jgi:Zn-dependent protease
MRPRWGVQLCTFRGTDVWLDASWVVLLPFTAWSLAIGYLPEHYPVFGVVLDWVMGLAGAAGLCVAVALHEAVHLLVQPRRAKPPCILIVHLVGSVPSGLASCGDGTDVWALAAGPLASLIVAAVTFWAALNAGPFSRPLEALLGYLAIVNVLLALVHSVPAWPFDAGRLLCCALPRLGVSTILAARIVRALGACVAIGLILLGGWQMIVAGSRLLGSWIAIVGALVAWALATDQYGYLATVPKRLTRAITKWAKCGL